MVFILFISTYSKILFIRINSRGIMDQSHFFSSTFYTDKVCAAKTLMKTSNHDIIKMNAFEIQNELWIKVYPSANTFGLSLSQNNGELKGETQKHREKNLFPIDVWSMEQKLEFLAKLIRCQTHALFCLSSSTQCINSKP